MRVRGWILSENAAMPPGQQVKVHKSASFVDILEVCKFTTLCDRKGYTTSVRQEGPQQGQPHAMYTRSSAIAECLREMGIEKAARSHPFLS